MGQVGLKVYIGTFGADPILISLKSASELINSEPAPVVCVAGFPAITSEQTCQCCQIVQVYSIVCLSPGWMGTEQYLQPVQSK